MHYEVVNSIWKVSIRSFEQIIVSHLLVMHVCNFHKSMYMDLCQCQQVSVEQNH